MSTLPHVHEATPRAAVARYFEISLYLLVLTGFFTVVTTGKLDLSAALLVTAALAYRGLLLVQRRTLVIPVRYTNYLTFVFAFFYVFDFFFISAQFVPATVHLVLLIMVVKLFSVQRDRDHVYLAVISFLMVLASAVLTVDSVFLGAFSVFMLLAVSTFASMEMKRSAAQASAALHSSAVQTGRMSRALVGTAALLMFGILVGAAVIFFLLPRVSGGYLSKYAPRNQLASGFSQEVELGQIGEIQQSQAVVMRVQIEGDTLGVYDLFWRGVALSTFDGKRWANRKRSGELRENVAGTYDLSRYYPPLTAVEPAPIRYRVLMEPIENNVFFLAERPQWLLGNYREIVVDDEASVFNRDLRRPITTYTGLSNVARPAPAVLRNLSEEMPPGIANVYLQLPVIDRRVTELARQVTQGEPTAYDKAASIERYLKTQFGYTLQLGFTAPEDPIAHFLFVRKEGHCEYFASSMTVMLRTLGIPARIVNGFRGGEFNDVSGSYVVRAADAHSWVEAYFPGTGWISFDPTPPSQKPAATGWHRMLLYMDAMREFWAEWVVNYDFQHQQSLTTGLARKGRFAARDLRQWWRAKYRELLSAFRSAQERAAENPQEFGMWSVLALALLIVLVSLPRMWRSLRESRVARSPQKNPDAAATIWYRRILRLLARRGWHKAPAQTPKEYVSTIGDELLRARMADFTAHYERARFGQSADDAAKLPEIFEEVKSRR